MARRTNSFPTGLTGYVTLFRQDNGEVFLPGTGATEVYVSAHRPTYAIPFQEDGGTGSGSGNYAYTIPANLLTVSWDEKWWQQVGGGPDDTADFRLDALSWQWNGDAAITPPLVGDAVSKFFTFTEFTTMWGYDNVRLASNKDNKNLDVNMPACQIAFTYADNEVEDALRGGVIGVPLDVADYGGAYPAVVKNWAMTIAWGRIYTMRGVKERRKNVVDSLAPMIESVYLEIGMYRSGFRQLSAASAIDYRGNSVMAGMEPLFGRKVPIGNPWYPDSLCW